MNKTEWKSIESINSSLKGLNSVSIFSCAICANLSDTGGITGIRIMKKILSDLGISVSTSRCVFGACVHEEMKSVLKASQKKIRKSDAVIILACSAGLKSAMLTDPGIPVLTPLDSSGSVPIAGEKHGDDFLKGKCNTCGHCIISFTGGICPLGQCHKGQKYGPCEMAPVAGDEKSCYYFSDKECVWKKIITGSGDLAGLGELEKIHSVKHYRRIKTDEKARNNTRISRVAGWVMARIRGVSGFVLWID